MNLEDQKYFISKVRVQKLFTPLAGNEVLLALLSRHHLVSCQDSFKEASGVANNVPFPTEGAHVPNNEESSE